MIKINGTRLAIIPLNFKMGDSKVSGYIKKELKYQNLLFRSTGDANCYYLSLDICGIMSNSAPVPSHIASSCSEGWGLIKTREKHSSTVYTAEEKLVLRAFIRHMIKTEHFDTAENLCFALDDEEIMKRFYSSYGKNTLDEFCEYVRSNTASSSITTKYSKIYQRNRYSVYQLIKDLVKDKAMIYTDPSLIGSYEKISRRVKDGSTFIPDRWSQIINSSGNMTRANLSFTYSGPHFVNVPENEFGITSGLKEVKAVKSLCIVKDGVLWTPQIGVKVNDKKLINKFRGARILKSNLVFDNEYLLDLTQIPIIGKSKLRQIHSWLLASYEEAYERRKINIEYYARCNYKKERKLLKLPEKIEEEVSESEKFLHSLGIYGENYIPPYIKTDNPDHTYESVELIGKVNGLPSNITKGITDFINTGYCRNELLRKVLQEASDLAKSSGDNYSSLIKEEMRCKESMAERLRDYKFRLIMGKTLKFSDSKNRADSSKSKVHTTLGKDYIETTVEWKLKKTKIIV